MENARVEKFAHFNTWVTGVCYVGSREWRITKNLGSKHRARLTNFHELTAREITGFDWNPLVSAETVCHSSTYIILYFLPAQSSTTRIRSLECGETSLQCDSEYWVVVQLIEFEVLLTKFLHKCLPTTFSQQSLKHNALFSLRSLDNDFSNITHYNTCT